MEISTSLLQEIYLKLVLPGNPGEIEKAIEFYESNLSKHDLRKAERLHLWVRMQNDLGIAYRKRGHGNKASNLEKAIQLFNHLVKVLEKGPFQYEYGGALHNLGNVYRQRLKGKRADNIEEALRLHSAALTVRPLDRYPVEWANTVESLATDFRNRTLGNIADNQETAIEKFYQAMAVYESIGSKPDIRTVEINLGNTYTVRLIGDRTENLEKAIILYEAALEKSLQANNRYELGALLGNLGNTYIERKKGDRATNIESAIFYLSKALELRKDWPLEWAETMNGLAVAYHNRIENDQLENIETAICYCQNALAIFESGRSALGELKCLTSLGNFFSDRIAGEKPGNIDLAVSYYESASAIAVRHGFVTEYMDIQNNLGNAYMEMPAGTKGDALKKAITAFKAILSKGPDEAGPYNFIRTAKNAGLLLFRNGEYEKAEGILEQCHQVLEKLRTGLELGFSKEKVLEDNILVYRLLVDCCTRNKKWKRAFEYACASKSRGLAEKLTAVKPGVGKTNVANPVMVQAFEAINDTWKQIESIETLLQSNLAGGWAAHGAYPEYDRYKEQLRQLYFDYSKKKERFASLFPDVAASVSLPPIQLAEVMELSVKLQCSIVEYYFHYSGWVAFVVNKKEFRCITLPAEADAVLEEAIDWMVALDGYVPDTCSIERQQTILGKIHAHFIEPVLGALRPDSRIMIAPNEKMHLFPLGLAWDEKNEQYLFEKHELFFIAGASVAKLVRRKSTGDVAKPRSNAVLAVAHNGNGSLQFAGQEAGAVCSFFKTSTFMEEEEATPQAIVEAINSAFYDVIHMSCHGRINYNYPDTSGLFINGILTVEKIFNEIKLNSQPLVVLSACETGRSTIGGGDELTGLNQAWLQAGSDAVISSVWSVDDQSTMLLFNEFYREWTRQPGVSPCTALRKAMLAVRAIPSYESVFFWGAFQLYGLPG